MNTSVINTRDVGKIGEQLDRLQVLSLKGEKVSFFDKLAKQAVLKQLENISQGSLTIEDGQDTYRFGQEAASLQAHVIVKSPKAYSKLAFGGNVGGGEGYMLAYWDTPSLIDVTRVLALNVNVLKAIDDKKTLPEKISSRIFHWLNNNSLSGSKENIAAHYDLGNDFFDLFLDKTMMYSSAIFSDDSVPLYDASVYKLDVVCQKLKLNESDHLVEIGTGWGGLAIHAASHYHCKVTTTTISQEQYDYANARVKELGLDDKIEVLLKDYRLLEGRFDKLVSIEMIEAVGQDHYQSYFKKCSSLLKQDGLMLIQAITIPDQRYKSSLKSVDFIQKYIFPGGRLPSNTVISENVQDHTDMQIVNLQDIGLDYSKTLKEWRHNFMGKVANVKSMGFDETFCRMWEYYLAYCEGGFQERAISTVQLVMAKPNARWK